MTRAIQKLDLRENVEIIPIKGSCHDYCLAKSSVLTKINEVIDAVNGILDYAPLEMAQKAEPVDPYAEQRRWIGKICKFWNWDTGLAHYSKLITIKDINDGEMSNCPFRADDGGWYMYCEPVKPTDSIIYKGGNNE